MHIAESAEIYLIFPPYRFTHPKTEYSIFVYRWSYLWAGLFGAAYVAFKGMGQRFMAAFAINVGFMILAVGAIGATSFPFVPKKTQALVIVGMVPILIAMQGTVMVRLIRDGYRRRGWKVMQD